MGKKPFPCTTTSSDIELSVFFSYFVANKQLWRAYIFIPVHIAEVCRAESFIKLLAIAIDHFMLPKKTK